MWGNQSDGFELDDSVVYTFWDGSSWSSPQNITEFPQTVENYPMDAEYDKNGNVMFVWLWDDGTSLDVYYSVWSGTDWSAMTQLTDDLPGQDEVYLKKDPENKLLLTYRNNDTNYVYSRIWDGASWSGESSVIERAMDGGQLLSNRNGAIGYYGMDQNYNLLMVRKTADGWDEPLTIGPLMTW